MRNIETEIRLVHRILVFVIAVKVGCSLLSLVCNLDASPRDLVAEYSNRSDGWRPRPNAHDALDIRICAPYCMRLPEGLIDRIIVAQSSVAIFPRRAPELDGIEVCRCR